MLQRLQQYYISRLCWILLCVGLLGLQHTLAAEPERASFNWNGDKQGKFVMALASDAQGQVWVGTEDQGLWRYNPHAAQPQQWTQFTTKDGLGDNSIYALTVDKLGRVWAGHLNHGVSVFNGQTWRNYGVLDGPLGERVFGLATCPTDGDVWIATNAGLTSYSLRAGTWTHYTRANGLPSDDMQALAFDATGTLYAGTQCDGLAIAAPRDGYATWRIVRGARRPTPQPSGHNLDILPSQMINAVLVARDGTVYVATPWGLGRSRDGGVRWDYARGGDYADKVRGRADGVPQGWKEEKTAALAEDYCTCLAEDGAGRLWVGHRQRGLEVFDPTQPKALSPRAVGFDAAMESNYTQAILVPPAGPALVAGYGGGLAVSASPVPLASLSSAPPTPPPLPAAAKPPSLVELNALLQTVLAVPPLADDQQPAVLPVTDDWTTEGAWLGRHGRYWACLCSLLAPYDYQWGAGFTPVRYGATIGPNHDKGDALRHWVHWVYTDNPHSLELPPTYLDSRLAKKLTTPDQNRRQAEWDDHGETYAQTKDGPHVYCTMTVPPGLFYLSLYDVNKDAHEVDNCLRDYRISIRPHPPGRPLANIGGFAGQPELAHSRINLFWGGVYKRFLVRGPSTLTLEINRTGSKNALLAAIMLDMLEAMPPPYFRSVAQWQAAHAQQAQYRQTLLTHASPPFKPATTQLEAANRLFHVLEAARLVNAPWWAISSRSYYAALTRWYELLQRATPAPTRKANLYLRLSACYYELGLYPQWEAYQQQGGLVPARAVEQALRWDGKAVTNSGQDYALAQAYMTTHVRPAALGLPQHH